MLCYSISGTITVVTIIKKYWFCLKTVSVQKMPEFLRNGNAFKVRPYPMLNPDINRERKNQKEGLRVVRVTPVFLILSFRYSSGYNP
jgi:hypothetical protein